MMIPWDGSLQQLLWLDGFPKAAKHRIYAALATSKYKLLWDAERLTGVLVLK